MDKIVVDSSVVIKWFVTEILSTEARQILAQYRDGALALFALDLLFAEIGNIIWKKQRFQGLSSEHALEIIHELQQLTFEMTPTPDLLGEAYRLAVKYERTVYDALYLALNIRERCPYVTADERLVNSIHSEFRNVIWLANWQVTE